jgi:hypothetical protein
MKLFLILLVERNQRNISVIEPVTDNVFRERKTRTRKMLFHTSTLVFPSLFTLAKSMNHGGSTDFSTVDRGSRHAEDRNFNKEARTPGAKNRMNRRDRLISA